MSSSHSGELFRLLKDYFGYDAFRPLQQEVISDILNHRDALLLMPTGGGKSICYQLPALMMKGTALVISPLISLMKDQVESLKANGIAAAFLNSSLGYEEEAVIEQQLKQEKLTLLYISPEKAISCRDRLLHDFRISLLAIDEAHCISSWGHDFRPEYQQLHVLKESFPEAPCIALTATADKITRRDIIMQLRLKNPGVYISSFDRPNLSLSVRHDIREKIKIEEITSIARKYLNQPGIVYCLSRKTAERVASLLEINGIKAASYHAGMNQSSRSDIQEAFINDKYDVICATIAFGMGINKLNVRYVVHYNLPRNIEGYYQEIGRAGRDGLPSETILYYNLNDVFMLRRFALDSGQPLLNIEKLKLMQHYAEAHICRRKILLNYFSESVMENCGNCDRCKGKIVYENGTIHAQKVISAMIRAEEKCTLPLLISVLRGSKNAEVIALNLHKLKTWGAGKDLSHETWHYYILQMIQTGIIEIAYDDNYTLKVTEAGRRVLKGELTVNFAQREELQLSLFNRAEEPCVHPALFRELRALRKIISDSAAIPAFQVFSDATLRGMTASLPLSAPEMQSIHGVSLRKMEKYGEEFLKVINNYITKNKIEKMSFNPVTDALSDENLRQYIEEMKMKKVRLSHQTLGKILLGSSTASGVEEQQLSFYGRLQNKTKYRAIGPLIKEYFEKNIYKEFSEKEIRFFEEPHFNNLSTEAVELLENIIAAMPIQRPTETFKSETMKKVRELYPRSHEPWPREEVALFQCMVDKTNDMNIYQQIFKRSPSSIRAAYASMLRSQFEEAN